MCYAANSVKMLTAWSLINGVDSPEQVLNSARSPWMSSMATSRKDDNWTIRNPRSCGNLSEASLVSEFAGAIVFVGTGPSSYLAQFLQAISIFYSKCFPQ